MPPRIPGDPSQVARAITTPSSGEPAQATSNNAQSFSSLMQKPDAAAANNKMISPLDLAQGGTRTPATPQSLLSQVNLMQNTMTALQGQMNHPNLKMKSSQKYLIKNKLSSALNSMHSVTSKIGGALDKEDSEGSPSQEGHKEEKKGPLRKISGPIGQFLNYITDGMSQLADVKKQLNDVGAKGKDLGPADFLFMQVKLAKAQQEMEFTSAVLTKATEDFKTIMNIQL